MSEQSLDLIKTRTVFLKEGELSGEIVLIDDAEGDMYFSILLQYVKNDKDGETNFEVIDGHHATLTIETRPFAFTKMNEPLEIGTYQNGKKLYLDIIVEPSLALGEAHRVTVNFYTNKENNGTK